MLDLEIDDEEGIAIVRPSGPLREDDFTSMAREVDAFLERRGWLRGLVIDAEKFPGWEDFGALVQHVKFVKDHHRRIRRVAAVTDSGFLAIVPKIANHFVAAEIRSFQHGDLEAARRWIREGDDNAAGDRG